MRTSADLRVALVELAALDRVSTFALLTSGEEADIRREMDTHFWATLQMVRTFVAVLGAGGRDPQHALVELSAA